MITERPLHVLVVDNDPGIQHLLVLIFQREGWRVTTARDGDAAIGLLRSELPDLLVMDLILPGKSGFDVLDWIESNDASWLRHVIVLTAASNSLILGLTKAHPIFSLVRKPFDLEDLVRNVKSCAAASGVGARQAVRASSRRTSDFDGALFAVAQ